jgi:hypothetical protein
VLDPPEYPKGLLERVEKDALTLCQALGYDLNTVEFAVEDGVPYAIDFMNPAPDADVHSVGKDSFEWIVDKVAKLAVEKAKGAGEPMKELKWSSFLGHEASGTVAAKSAAKKASGSSTRVAIEKNAAEKREVRAAGKKRASKKRENL